MVWSFRSSSLITLYTKHSPRTRSTLLIVSLHLTSRASLSSPFSSPCCLNSQCSAFLSCYTSIEQQWLHDLEPMCKLYWKIALCIYRIRPYHRQIDTDNFLTSVGLALLTPINMKWLYVSTYKAWSKNIVILRETGMNWFLRPVWPPTLLHQMHKPFCNMSTP